MIKKYLLVSLVFFLLFASVSENVKAFSLKDFFSVSIFSKNYNPEKNVCQSYSTKSGTELGDLSDSKDIFDVLYNEGLVRCSDFRMKTPCELNNMSWTNNEFISKKDTFKFEKNVNYFELEDKTICREITPMELKIKYCSNL